MEAKAPVRTKSPITGKLVRIDRQVASALGKGEGVMEFADSEHQFAMGDFVVVSGATGEPKLVLVAPVSAVLVTAEGSYVYVVNGSHLSRTKIKTGASDNGMVEVEDGLYAGDSVVIKGIENLWLVELSALKGGTPCCPVAKKT
jgi:multidrug efflux pump subunit AcrA (membrane-fusion protein)